MIVTELNPRSPKISNAFGFVLENPGIWLRGQIQHYLQELLEAYEGAQYIDGLLAPLWLRKLFEKLRACCTGRETRCRRMQLNRTMITVQLAPLSQTR
jgi:hypothetical protein